MTDRIDQTEDDRITGADIVDGILILRRHDGSTTESPLGSSQKFQRHIHYYASNHVIQGVDEYFDIDDNNFGVLQLDLLEGDNVDLEFRAPFSVPESSKLLIDWNVAMNPDFQEIAGSHYSALASHVIEGQAVSDISSVAAQGSFVPEFDGLYTFVPQWKSSDPLCMIANLTPDYSAPSVHTVTNRGQQAE